LPAEGAIHCDRFSAVIDGRLVVLDVRKDRYYLAEPRDGSQPKTVPAGQEPPRPRAQQSLWAGTGFSPGAAVASLACLRSVSRLLEQFTFAELVEAVRSAPVRPGRPRLAPRTIVGSFEAVRPLFPRRKICRLDAPAICLTLRRHGHAAQLVFGARLEPFAAHCWTELDGAVVNDAHEKVREFTAMLEV